MLVFINYKTNKGFKAIASELPAILQT